MSTITASGFKLAVEADFAGIPGLQGSFLLEVPSGICPKALGRGDRAHFSRFKLGIRLQQEIRLRWVLYVALVSPYLLLVGRLNRLRCALILGACQRFSPSASTMQPKLETSL